MRLSNKQKEVVARLRSGWIIKSHNQKFWLFKNGSFPEMIHQVTFTSLRDKLYLKQIPADRFDERWYEYSPRGVKELQRRKEEKSLKIPSFAFN